MNYCVIVKELLADHLLQYQLKIRLNIITIFIINNKRRETERLVEEMLFYRD